MEQLKHIEHAFEKYIVPLITSLKEDKKVLQRFLELLVDEYYPTLWTAIEQQNLKDSDKDEYLKMLLFLPENQLQSLNIASGDNRLWEYIYNKEDFIAVFSKNENINDVKKLIKALDIKFKNLELNQYEDNKLFNYIYENNCYDLTQDMLYLMLQNKGKYEINEFNNVFKSQNYTCIRESGCNKLIDYILDHYDIYTEDIYLKLPDKQQESEEALSALIDIYNPEEDLEMLSKLLSKISTQITNLDNFSQNDKWKVLFDNNNISPNWENLISYIKHIETPINKTIINWLNRKDVTDSITTTHFKRENFNPEDSDLISSVMVHIIEADKLDDTLYTKLIQVLPDSFPRIILERLSKNKINELISYSKIKFNQYHYDQLLNMAHPQELYQFTRNNLSTFISDYSDFAFDQDLHITLFSTDNLINLDIKLLIKLMPIEEINNPKLAKLIGDKLLASSIPLLENNKIVSIVRSCQDLDIKLRILNRFTEDFNFEEIDAILNSMGNEYAEASKLRKRPTWPYSTLNLSIAQKLNNMNYFSSISVEGKDEIKIIARQNLIN